MILHALVKRYEETGNVSQGWQARPMDFAINLNADGDILDLINLEETDGKKKTRRIGLLPEEPAGRTSGIKAAFLCDNAGYIFGIDPKGEAKKRGEKKFSASKELHVAVLKNLNSEFANAILAFFNRHPMPTLELPEMKNNCVFMVNGKFAYEDPKIKEAWDKYKSEEEKGSSIRCLISGDLDAIAILHGKISLPGVSMGAVPLVSANSESFTSYGKTMDDPAADIGEKATFAYVTALNELLKSEKHRQRIASDTLVYWAEGGGETESETFSWFSKPEENDQEKLSAILKKVAQGEKIDIEGCKMKIRFFLLCLSPNAGRISVRFFYQNSFENILDYIVEHYQNMDIIGSQNTKFQMQPPWMLLSETTIKKSASDALPLLGGQLLQSILTGSNYPLTLYNAILNRAKANEEINRTKAAIIKAVLIRNYAEKEVTTVSLNKESTNKPYVLGRLFAILERLQQQASGGNLNSTIRDRYFASASANPKSVFPTILKLSMHHAAKLEEGSKVYFEKLKTDIIGKLDEEEPFPATLSLDDQGRFILGYYHQTQDFFTSKKNTQAENDENKKEEAVNE
jgi:CRISPR-associated protein Csd1